jgi:polar amino acid transport system permease protein
MNYHWDFSAVTAFGSLWLRGAGVTLVYAFGTILGGLAIGILCAVATLNRKRWLVSPIYAYVSVFRCTPVLVQIMWIYYALPIVINLSIPAWLASGLGLMLYMGCFATEIVRGGIISIDKGQWNAARALGMTSPQMMRRIICRRPFAGWCLLS